MAEHPPAAGNAHPAARLVTVPNILSASRLALLPVVLLLLFRRDGVAAVGVMGVSWLTDALDGFLARRLNQVSNLGRVLDHLVDKVFVGSVVITLVFIRGLPLGIALAVVVRDLLILSGSLIIMKARGSFVSSDVLGRITGCAFAAMMLFYTLSLPQLARLKPVVDSTVGVLIVVSFLNYVVLFLRKMVRLRLPGEDTD